jgi:hypothetical protein
MSKTRSVVGNPRTEQAPSERLDGLRTALGKAAKANTRIVETAIREAAGGTAFEIDAFAPIASEIVDIRDYVAGLMI